MQVNNTLLKCGETGISNQVDRLGLSPMPITNGREPIAISQFITTTESGLLKIRLVNADVHMTQMFLTIVLLISGMVFLFWINTAERWLETLPMLGPITLFFLVLFYVHFKDSNKSLANSPPIILYPHKQEILMSKLESDSLMSAPPIMTDKFFFITIIAFVGLSVAISSLLSDVINGEINADYLTIIYFIVGIPCAIYSIRPWLAYFKAHRNCNGKQVVFGVAWDHLSVEYQRHDGVNQWGAVSLQNLTFTAPAEYGNNVGFSLPVYSKEEAFSLFELIRDYMENGAEGIEYTAANNIKTSSASYSRAGYRRLILKRMRKTPLIYPFWRLFNIITLRYISHWYLEYQMDTLQQKALERDDVKAWLAPLPKEQWITPSAELTEANSKVRALYAQGLRWEDDAVQNVIKQYH